MILPEANPEEAIAGLRKLCKKFSMGGNDDKFYIVNNAISCINRMQIQIAELKEQQIEAIVKTIMLFFPDEPCNFNCMDELCDDWCCDNCGKTTAAECWKHAIEADWPAQEDEIRKIRNAE